MTGVSCFPRRETNKVREEGGLLGSSNPFFVQRSHAVTRANLFPARNPDPLLSAVGFPAKVSPSMGRGGGEGVEVGIIG